MHPALILVSAAALILGPGLWVKRVLEQHNREEEDFPATGGDAARQLLDRHQLQSVKVQCTDIGDHYDPDAKAVRLTRDKFERKTLTALTTAAHEVGHALQHASHYPPFLWRTRLVQVARVTGELGAVILISVPTAALMSRRPVSPVIVGSTVFAMLGAGLAAQLAALPTEVDASFRKALPMLQDGYIHSEQVKDAKSILVACSLTYVAASFASVLSIWPWLGPRLALVWPGNPFCAAGGKRLASVVGRTTLPLQGAQ
jgi:Zn-dependent membrane protease YugP